MAEALAEQEEFPPADQVQPQAPQAAPQSKDPTGEYLFRKQQGVLSDLEGRAIETKSNQAQEAMIRDAAQQKLESLTPGMIDAAKGVEGAAQNIMGQQAPHFPAPPKLQNFINKDQANIMMGVASLIAGFNSNGRMRGIRANQALAAGINGYVNGNLEMAKLGLEDWKHQIEQQKLEFETMRQNNLDILNASGKSLEAKKLETEMAMKPYGMKLEGFKVGQDYVNDVVKIDTQMAQIIGKMEESIKPATSAIQMLSLEERIRHNKAMEAKTGGPGGDETILGIPKSQIPQAQPGQKNEAFLNMLSPFDQNIVKQLVNRQLTAKDFGGFGAQASARRFQYEAAASTYDPGFKGYGYDVNAKAEKEATPGGPVGSNELAINTLPHHVDQYIENFKKLNNSQVQRWNSARNRMTTEFGDPALGNVQAAAYVVSEELARVAKGGRAAPDKDEVNRFLSIFNTSDSPEQAIGKAWETLKIAGGRLAAIQETYNKMGLDRQVLTPEAKALIKKYQPKNAPTPDWLGGGSAGTPAARRTAKDKNGKPIYTLDGKTWFYEE